MYFPYLFGRSAELDAIRTQAPDFGGPQEIVPVIEPAAANDADMTRYVNKLTRTLERLRTHHCKAYVMVNPSIGIFESPADVAAWASAMSTKLLDPHIVYPTYKVRAGTTQADVTGFANTYQHSDLGTVVNDEKGLSPADLAAALGGRTVRLFLMPGVDSAPFVAQFGLAAVIRIVDNFPAQARNADYSGSHPFGSNHLTPAAKTPGGGFGDFTVLAPIVRFSGGATGAAVIHLTYQDPATQNFEVEHFLSTDQSTSTNFQTKLLQAIATMQTAIANKPGKYAASPAVADYQQQLANNRGTSQGNNKKLHIAHHLHTVARHLGI